MGISIPNIRNTDDATNAHRKHKQADQTYGTITLQCKVSTFFLDLS